MPRAGTWLPRRRCFAIANEEHDDGGEGGSLGDGSGAAAKAASHLSWKAPSPWQNEQWKGGG